MILYTAVIIIYLQWLKVVFFLFYLLLQKVAKTTDEAGKSITLNRPCMFSENVFFSREKIHGFSFLFSHAEA